MTLPKRQHKALQRRIRKLLEVLCEPKGYTVDTEYPYKPLPEHEVWGADIAVISNSREDEVRDWLEGSPELVIEVKGRSNTKAELNDKAMTTLAGPGSVEFWIVDSKQQNITVYTRTSGIHVYPINAAVPMISLGDERLPVRQIFL